MTIMTQQELDSITAAPYTSILDLEEYSQRGDQVVVVQIGSLPVAAFAAVGTFLTGLEKLKGTILVRDYSSVSVYLALTPEQITTKLEAANTQLAADRQKYLTALAFGTGDEWDVKSAVRRFGERAGLAQTLPVHAED